MFFSHLLASTFCFSILNGSLALEWTYGPSPGYGPKEWRAMFPAILHGCSVPTDDPQLMGGSCPGWLHSRAAGGILQSFTKAEEEEWVPYGGRGVP